MNRTVSGHWPSLGKNSAGTEGTRAEAVARKGATTPQSARARKAIAFYKGLLEKFPANEEIGRLAHSGLSIVEWQPILEVCQL